MFRLGRGERDEVVANCDHLRPLKFSPTMPFAFAEHGALMAAYFAPYRFDSVRDIVRMLRIRHRREVGYRD